MSTTPWPPGLSSRNGVPAEDEEARIVESPARACACPSVSAASAMNGLIRRTRRIRAAQRTIQQRLVGRIVQLVPVLRSMPSTNRFGSKLGVDTNASTSPVAGSIATSAPRRSPNACFGHLLQADIERQHQVVAGRSPACATACALRGRRQSPRPPRSPSVPCSSRLVTLLDADLADVVGALVVGASSFRRVDVARCPSG